MPSPPKPWEVNNTAATSTPVVSQSSMTDTTAPTVPTRPSTMNTGMTSGYNGNITILSTHNTILISAQA